MGEVFDTSGVALAVRPDGSGHMDGWLWEHLTPFQQGYVEALFSTLRYAPKTPLPDPPSLGWRSFAFSSLSPEALAMILGDCEAFCSAFGRDTRILPQGQAFWTQRQDGGWANQSPSFPPLRVSLSDDGKIHLQPEEAGR